MYKNNKTIHVKKLALAFILIALMQKGKSQNVSYRVIDDDVENLKRVNIQINPFCIDMNPGLNFATIGAGITGDITILKRLEISGGYRMAYLDANSGLTDKSSLTGLSHPTCSGGTNRSNYLEAATTFYLFERTKTKNLEVVLHSSTSGGYSYKTSIRVPGYRRRMFGFRGGFFMYNTGTQIGEEKSHQIAYQITNGNDTMPFGNPTVLNYDGSNTTYVNTMVNSMVFNVGISLKSITNLIVTADGYGRKRHSGVYDFYLELLTAPYVSVKDVYTAGGKKWDVRNKKGQYKELGWRLGLSYKGSGKRVSFYYKFEIGERPGIDFGKEDRLLQGNVNALLTMGMNIPFLAKK